MCSDLSGYDNYGVVELSAIANVIVKIAAVVSAILIIYGAAVKIIKPINELIKKIDKLERQNTENYLSLLRLTIMSEEMPLEERISAGDKYVIAGGNGAIKHKYHDLISQLDNNGSKSI